VTIYYYHEKIAYFTNEALIPVIPLILVPAKTPPLSELPLFFKKNHVFLSTYDNPNPAFPLPIAQRTKRTTHCTAKRADTRLSDQFAPGIHA
jgi:hypothetical protein